MIGDVLRTADQVPSRVGDAAFVEALRRRLEDEPVVLAPSGFDRSGAADRAGRADLPAVAVQASRAPALSRSWRAPMAAMAGAAAVAGVVFVMRPGLPDAQAPLTASAPVSRTTRHAAAQPVGPGVGGPGRSGVADGGVDAASVVVVRDPRMLRDERLDRYLDAHRQFSESALSVVPAATVRGVSTLAPER